MKKLLGIAGIFMVFGFAVDAVAQPTVYAVSGVFTSPGNFAFSAGAGNTTDSGSVGISGFIYTDSNTAGYNITGGSIVINGSLHLPTAGGIYLTFNNATGVPANNGVLLTSGTLCVESAVGNCDLAVTDFGTAPGAGDLRSGVTWGFNTTAGLQLTGGAGGSSFSVAQPGATLTPLLLQTGAVGAMTVAGNQGGMFLGGNLNFNESVAPPSVTDFNAIPTLPLYGLVMTVLGLALVGWRRLRQVASRK